MGPYGQNKKLHTDSRNLIREQN